MCTFYIKPTICMLAMHMHCYPNLGLAILQKLSKAFNSGDIPKIVKSTLPIFVFSSLVGGVLVHVEMSETSVM